MNKKFKILEVAVIRSNNLREIRKQKNLSQLALSRKTGVPGNVISNLENYKVFPYPSWKRKLAKALETPENELFPDNEF